MIIDNHLPRGDTLVQVDSDGLKTGPGSTVVGAAILNALLTEVVETLIREDGQAPVYISANMPGAAAHNQRLIEAYRGRNPHL